MKRLSTQDGYTDDWNPATDPIDFGMVSTPSTTYAFVYAYDSSYKDRAPLRYYSDSNFFGICDLVALVSDNIAFLTNRQVTKQAYLDQLAIGKNYRFLYVIGFAHGFNDKAPAGTPPPDDSGGKWCSLQLYNPDNGGNAFLQSYEVWNALADARANIVLGLDSCGSAGWKNGVDDIEQVDMTGYVMRGESR